MRQAEMSEIPEIRELIKEMLEELGVSQAQLEFEMNVRYGFSALRRKMSVEEEFFLFAEDKKSTLGLLTLKPSKSGLMNIGKIYVRKSSRKKGVGRMLVGFAEQMSRDQGKHKLVILARAENKDALSFYDALGFNREGELKKHHWGIDYIAFGRQVEPFDEPEPADEQPEPEPSKQEPESK